MKIRKTSLRQAIIVAFTALMLVICTIPAHAANFKEGYSLSGSAPDKMVNTKLQ